MSGNSVVPPGATVVDLSLVIAEELPAAGGRREMSGIASSHHERQSG